MLEEGIDVKAPEAEASEPTESSPVEQDSVPEEGGDENKIPHSRVKEMEKKAFDRGREEALKKLLSEQQSESSESVAESEEVEASVPDEKTEAMKILREAIKAEIDPLKKDIIKREVQDFLGNNPDAVEYVDKIKDLRAGNPKLSWEEAYKLSSFDDKMKAAESRGVERGETGVAAKEAATTEKPSTAPGKMATKSLNEKISSGEVSVAEAEKLIKERFNIR